MGGTARPDPADFNSWAFFMEPLFTQNADGAWTAAYPDTDWSVTASTRPEALRALMAETVRRQSSTDESQHLDPHATYRRHLHTPVTGVYAMDSDLYAHLVTSGVPEPEIQRVFAVAERHRTVGRRYTRDDHRAAQQSAAAPQERPRPRARWWRRRPRSQP